jgi:hypothetical protein
MNGRNGAMEVLAESPARPSEVRGSGG